ncbi:hypothetical protein [Nocardioides taihuensis]|uniref:Uncharacterized protein n=1 Tax=Nocardioides taihuensis TaxID=1835606 RepID=A0ABW0BQI3_9ACTN
MSGKHVKRVAWRPRRPAPLLTLLAGFGTWVALAAVLVLLPSTSPADVHGPIGGQTHDRGDDDVAVVPPQTLSTGSVSPSDPTPSGGAARVSRDAPGTTEQDAATSDPTTSAPTGEPTGDPTTADPAPAPTSPPGQANGHDHDHPGQGHGPPGKP